MFSDAISSMWFCCLINSSLIALKSSGSDFDKLFSEISDDEILLTTEKDYYRIKDYKFDEIKYLKISVHINNKEKLIDRILKVYDQDD